MFTGIVSAKGLVQKIQNNAGFATIVIKAPKGFSKNLRRGASVAVNGVCLTVKRGATDSLEFDVIAETLDKTNLIWSSFGKGFPTPIFRRIKFSVPK